MEDDSKASTPAVMRLMGEEGSGTGTSSCDAASPSFTATTPAFATAVSPPLLQALHLSLLVLQPM